MTNPKSQQNNRNLLLKYAGLGMQILVGLALSLWIGLKLDSWLNFAAPLLVWILPLLVIVAMIYQVIKDTSNKK